MACLLAIYIKTDNRNEWFQGFSQNSRIHKTKLQFVNVFFWTPFKIGQSKFYEFKKVWENVFIVKMPLLMVDGLILCSYENYHFHKTNTFYPKRSVTFFCVGRRAMCLYLTEKWSKSSKHLENCKFLSLIYLKDPQPSNEFFPKLS